MPATLRLAQWSQLSTAETQMLTVAAAFHDTGFTKSRREHEATSVAIMREALPRFGFAPRDIGHIAEIIMATRLPQSPRNKLGKLLADADLDVLGRPDFFARSEILRQETAVFGEVVSSEDWQAQQLQFLQEHRYLSPAGQALRDAGKQANIRTLLDRFSGNARQRLYTP